MDVLQAVLEASPNAVLIVDTDGVIRHANRMVPDVLGYGTDEIEGMVVEDLLIAEDRTDHVRFREEYMANPEPRPMGRELDLYARHKDGREVPVEISLGPIRRDGASRIVATVADITKRREREQELQRQNDRLEEFTSVVSHDLRNPLTVAEGRLDLARAECNSAHLDHVERAHDRMKTLIEDLLTLAREGDTDPALEWVDLDGIAEACWLNVETSNSTLTVATGRTIRADPGRLKQLLENLFRNAVEHGDGAVTVTVRDHETGFFIEDDGPGIPADRREKVFETGYSTSDDGTGFGLAIVKQIVGIHGWEIEALAGEAGGARFEISGVDFDD